MSYFENVGTALSVLANTIIGGEAYETLSERIGESILRGGLASRVPWPGWLREHFERAASDL